MTDAGSSPEHPSGAPAAPSRARQWEAAAPTRGLGRSASAVVCSLVPNFMLLNRRGLCSLALAVPSSE